MLIDFHTHTFPDAIAPAAIAKLKAASGTVAFTDGTADGLKRSMRRAGIDLSVVLPVATNPLKATSMNDVSLRLNGRDGLCYFGCIHPDTPDAEGELRRIASAGLAGVKIHPVYQGADIDDPRYLRILNACGELGLTVVMHAGDDIGFPGVVRCPPEAIARALKQVSPVRLVCAHMGGWRNWERVADALADTSVLLDTAFSLGNITPLPEHPLPTEDCRLMAEEAFLALVEAFGSHRILFATDSPWDDQAAAVERIRRLPLSPAALDAILGGNACRLLGL